MQISETYQHAIGDFLRQQRLRAEAGLHAPTQGRRRHVSHLTQAEVAELAGVSEAVVAQIEAGRYPNLNPRILAKLEEALQLEPHQVAYLNNLLMPPSNGSSRPRADLLHAVQALVDAAEPNPACIIDLHFDILYWNRSIAAMLGDFGSLPPEERNVVWTMFRWPDMRRNWVTWEANARNIIAGFRMQRSMLPPDDVAADRLIARLSVCDEQFAAWWAAADPEIQPIADKDFRHPEVGLLRIHQTVTAVLGAPDLMILQMTPRDEATRLRLQRLLAHSPNGHQPLAANEPRRFTPNR